MARTHLCRTYALLLADYQQAVRQYCAALAFDAQKTAQRIEEARYAARYAAGLSCHECATLYTSLLLARRGTP